MQSGRRGLLVWQAPSLVMNPTLDPAKIQAAIAEDPERARAEWDAVWRAGVSAFLVGEAFMRAPDPGLELARLFA